MQKKVKVEQEMNLLEQQKKHGSVVMYGDSIQVYRYCILVYKTYSDINNVIIYS